MNWEYDIVELDIYELSDLEILNEWGKHRWELVQIISDPTTPYAVFKRERVETDLRYE